MSTSPNPFRNRIVQGDCTQVMRQMASGSVDFILTDPPMAAITGLAMVRPIATTTTHHGFVRHSAKCTVS
jgi:predicted methyltransferase